MESNKQNITVEEKDYRQIVDNCAKATQINPLNSAAWQIFSQTNDAASYFYSKKFAKQIRGSAQGMGLKLKVQSNESIHFLLHREFGHNFLPKLLDNRFNALGQAKGFEKVHQEAYDLAKKYVAHVTSAVKGLV